MRFSSWNNFIDGVTNFEKYIVDKKGELDKTVQDLKDKHPLFDEITKKSIPFLLSPLNGIAQAIYDSFDGSDEEKTDKIKKFLDDIKRQGEDH